MDYFYSMSGKFIPLWILGAPLLAALVSLVTTPRSRTRTDRQDLRVPQPSQSFHPSAMGTGRL